MTIVTTTKDQEANGGLGEGIRAVVEDAGEDGFAWSVERLEEKVSGRQLPPVMGERTVGRKGRTFRVTTIEGGLADTLAEARAEIRRVMNGTKEA